MGKIIGISGRKQAGKNTVANIMHGICLKNQDLVQDWAVGSNGELIILTSNDKGVTAWGEFDVSRKDSSFIEYAELQMWPFIKLYSFADSLKKYAPIYLKYHMNVSGELINKKTKNKVI